MKCQKIIILLENVDKGSEFCNRWIKMWMKEDVSWKRIGKGQSHRV